MKIINCSVKHGQVVTVLDSFDSSRLTIQITANVDRCTATQVIVNDAHGNERRFNRKTGRVIGFVWPQVALLLGNEIGKPLQNI